MNHIVYVFRMKIGIVFLVVVVASTTVLHAGEALEIFIGGTSGWLRPDDPSWYSNWEDLKFSVGDVLVFNFLTGHNVAGVTKDGYDGCDTNNPKFINTTSPFLFTIKTLDDLFFICTVPDHCSAGQKIAITNIQQSSSTPSSPDSPPVVTAPPPPNSVASTMTSIFTVAFVSMAVMLIIY